MPVFSIGLKRMLKIDAKQRQDCEVQTLAALDRLESELGQSDYLAGESFSVADLTARRSCHRCFFRENFLTCRKARFPNRCQNLRDELCNGGDING